MSNPYSSPDQNTGLPAAQLAQHVRSSQTVTFALCMGVLVFMGITLMMNEGAMDGEPDILSWIALGFAGLMFVNHLVIPKIVSAATLKNVAGEDFRQADDAKKFQMVAPVFQTQHIIACALLEGAAFFNLIAYMTTEYVGNLAAATVLVAIITMRFPTVTRVQFWVQDRIRELELS